MGTIRTFRDLVAYQRARALSNAVHAFTRSLPQHCPFEIASQLRRASSSVRLNIAEGFGIGTNPGLLRHLRIARGSLFEADAALEQISDVGLGVPSPEMLDLIQETDRVLQGLIRSLERKAKPPAS